MLANNDPVSRGAVGNFSDSPVVVPAIPPLPPILELDETSSESEELL